jgi:hypothetical protein
MVYGHRDTNNSSPHHACDTLTPAFRVAAYPRAPEILDDHRAACAAPDYLSAGSFDGLGLKTRPPMTCGLLF